MRSKTLVRLELQYSATPVAPATGSGLGWSRMFLAVQYFLNGCHFKYVTCAFGHGEADCSKATARLALPWPISDRKTVSRYRCLRWPTKRCDQILPEELADTLTRSLQDAQPNRTI